MKKGNQKTVTKEKSDGYKEIEKYFNGELKNRSLEISLSDYQTLVQEDNNLDGIYENSFLKEQDF